MNLYLISQTVNDDYDTFDSAIVAAKSAKEAASINPSGPWPSRRFTTFNSWCNSPDEVEVKLIGKAKPGTIKGLILGSFNAG